MADTFIISIPENFDFDYLGQRLREIYQAKGFSVAVLSGENNLRIQFDKNCGGINMLFGMGKGITANCIRQGNSLVVNYTEGDWIGKIVGLAVGWILCLIPFITSIIGCVGQLGLPKEINSEILMIVSSLSNNRV